jgi:hypothetical protein
MTVRLTVSAVPPVNSTVTGMEIVPPWTTVPEEGLIEMEKPKGAGAARGSSVIMEKSLAASPAGWKRSVILTASGRVPTVSGIIVSPAPISPAPLESQLVLH